MPTLHVLRVFVSGDGSGGNPLGVFLDGAEFPEERRQAVATDIGFSETVFVDDAVEGRLRIFTPGTELDMAGHPLVGTSWLLAEHGRPVDVLRPPAGEVPTWTEGEATWIRGPADAYPMYELRQLGSPEEVEAQPGAPGEDDNLQVWAWMDEERGIARVRVFPRGLGIEEDEATGKAALQLAAQIGRPIVIHQGENSVILARPGPGDTAEIGGRARLLETRAYEA